MSKPLLATYDLYVLGSPTYGRGDWHYRWEDHIEEVLAVIPSGAKVALLALGDQRFHGRSFAGALHVLHNRVARAEGCIIFGAVMSINNDYQSAPSIGLILDLHSGQKIWGNIATNWLRSIHEQLY